MVTRTSTRQAAQKAKEAITTSSEPSDKASAGSKRKVPSEKSKKVSRPKKEKVEEAKQEAKPPNVEPTKDDDVSETKPTSVTGTQIEVEKQPEPQHAVVEGAAIHSAAEPKPKEETKPESVPGTHIQIDQPTKSEANTELGVHTSEERENTVPSNILEKGIIYFFFRPRVNVDDPQGVGDVARSFFVLRPTPLGAELDQNQGPVDKDARCRLLMLPKKKFPTTPQERDMGFVEKAGQTMKDLQENFIAARTYETATRGERTTEEARPYAEGVYAITSTKRTSHLAYVLTIPAQLGEIQENFGLRHRGSWIISAKNPKFPGPNFAQLPKDPEYPESVREKFGDLRWVPLEPEFIEYPNAQFLMIGEAANSLGKAATAEGNKEPHEQEPGRELENLEIENEQRVEALQGDQTIFQDLGLHAKKHAALETTWTT